MNDSEQEGGLVEERERKKEVTKKVRDSEKEDSTPQTCFFPHKFRQSNLSCTSTPLTSVDPLPNLITDVHGELCKRQAEKIKDIFSFEN